MKKLLMIILSMVILGTSSLSFASTVPTLIINGERVPSDVNPVVRNGRTLVPIRVISERLGATVNYDNKTKQVTVKRSNTTIKLTINNKVATVNNVKKVLDEPARAINGRTLVPARFVSESFGISVQYIASKKEVHIGKPSYVTEGTYRVGVDIAPGEYVLFPDGLGYFEVNADTNGNDTISNDNFSYPRYITVNSGVFITISDAKMYPIAKAPAITFPSDKYVGYLKVGRDIEPGTYLVKTYGGEGYYEICDEYDEIFDNNFFKNQTYITIKEGQYLMLSKCFIPR